MTHRPAPRKPPVPSSQRSPTRTGFSRCSYQQIPPLLHFPGLSPLFAPAPRTHSPAEVSLRPSCLTCVIPNRLPSPHTSPCVCFSQPPEFRFFRPQELRVRAARCRLSALTAPAEGLARGLGANQGTSSSEIQARPPDLRPDLQVTVRKALPLPLPLPSNLQLPELFHHHQRVKIRVLNPQSTRHHPVGLEAILPVKLPATWIVDRHI